MMLSQQADLQFGHTHEISQKSNIELLVGEPVDYKGGFNLFDYRNKAQTIFVELKSRRIRHDDYDTAIIGMNKVEFCSDPTKSYWFCYNYLDGLYYIKYDKALFDTFESNMSFTRGDRLNCPGIPNHVLYIPVRLLKKFENKI